MSQESTDIKTLYNTTKLIYFALIAGLMFFLATALYLAGGSHFFKPDFTDPLTLVVIVFLCTAIPVGYFVAKNNYKTIKPGDTLKEKLPIYQTSLIIRIASCEGVGLFTVVQLIITSNLFFIVPFCLALAIIIYYYPNPEKLGIELELTENEIELLKN